ncbi:hypothetical protein FHG87_018286 [Trinorchestia longiramus]|nr:hypothetical protein FHG87_018286 [Trinorchestia longiramus]
MHTKNVNVTQAAADSAETGSAVAAQQQLPNVQLSPLKKQAFENIPENSFLHRLHQQVQQQQQQHQHQQQLQQHHQQQLQQHHQQQLQQHHQQQQSTQSNSNANPHGQFDLHGHQQTSNTEQNSAQLDTMMTPSNSSPYQPPPLPPRCQPRSPQVGEIISPGPPLHHAEVTEQRPTDQTLRLLNVSSCSHFLVTGAWTPCIIWG